MKCSVPGIVTRSKGRRDGENGGLCVDSLTGGRCCTATAVIVSVLLSEGDKI